MRKCFIFLITVCSFLSAHADHIAGGELFYEYIGSGSSANLSRYKITMRLFRDCHSSGQSLTTERVIVGVYNSNNLSLHTEVTLAIELPVQSINLNTDAIPCLVNAPEVCFQIGIFTGTVELPSNTSGFTLSWIRCCRSDNLGNMSVSSGIGGTFVTKIPGTGVLQNGHNSSPQFAIKDTALVCQNKNFILDFGATDPDGDLLTYSFCEAYLGGTTGNPNPGSSQAGVPSVLSLNPLPYQSPFTGQKPLGNAVTINNTTGKITGTAPAAGRYVINVCITEWRNGIAINEHRKDFILQVGNCDYAAALPVPVSGAYCEEFKVKFNNTGSSSTIKSYEWDFGLASSTTDTSSVVDPIFTYPDTGLYKIRLIVKGAAGCIDTGYSTLGVYPGFKPDFEVTGSCYQSPFKFVDKSTTNYGSVNSWSWDFGDPNSSTDVSALRNPDYKYSETGTRNVVLTVTSSKGCKDKITRQVTVTDKPYLELPFTDTLICSIDSLPLAAKGSGAFSWSPGYNIVNANTATPLVYPKRPTTYTVTLTENTCVASATVRVNVVDSVNLFAGADTTICSTDAITFNPVSQGLQYKWTPTADITGIATVKNAVAVPRNTTTFQVTATIGKCKASDSIKVSIVPYPRVSAGADATICYGTQTQLAGNTNASYFSWTPTNTLLNEYTLTPVAKPVNTTLYILQVSDTLGCPKTVSDTVAVTVVPRVRAFAGRDTVVVANQPLQLQASGGAFYSWTPAIGMNNTSVANPIVVLGPAYDSIVYKVRVSVSEGCFEDDDVKVTVFKTAPDIFVPTAFTPNRDGKNDVLRPIAVGMKTIGAFRVYNRWGQQVYKTEAIGQGWDGTLGGKDQTAGTYVFTAEGVDYLGKKVFKKGTVVLIR